MKRQKLTEAMRKSSIGALLFTMMLIPMMAYAGSDDPAPKTHEDNVAVNSRVLVIRALDNVKSNYYDDYLLAENTDIAQDSVNQVYNGVVEHNLQKAGTGLHFVNMDDHALNSSLWQPIVSNIVLKGEGENLRADLSAISRADLKKAMQDAGAQYLLVIDAQYLRYSEKPMPMMYHFVNYSLYDSNEKMLTSGQNYFPAYQPQRKAELEKASMKSVRKIAEQLSKVIKAQ